MEPSKRVEAIPPSATLSISARAGELRAAGEDVVALSAGQPDFPTPAHIVDAARQALADGAFGYTPTAGTPALRQAVAETLGAATGQSLTPAHVLVSTGAKQSLHNLMMALVDPGDEVLVPAPYWVSYPTMAESAGGVFKALPTTQADGFKLRPDTLREALNERSRVLILNTPSNPTGAAYDRADLEALAEVVLSHPRLVVVSDEIYRHLTYGGFQHTSFAALGPDAAARCFVVDGVSKAYAMTGWRIGYTVGDPKVIAGATRYQDHSTSCPSAVSQAAALAALTGPQEPVETMRKAFEKRCDLVVNRIAEIDALNLSRPQGAFYAFVGVAGDAGKDDTRLCERLIEEAHVAAVPGSAFGAPGHIRLSFAAATDRIEEGLKRIASMLTALVLVFALAACGDDDGGNNQNNSGIIERQDVLQACLISDACGAQTFLYSSLCVESNWDQQYVTGTVPIWNSIYRCVLDAAGSCDAVLACYGDGAAPGACSSAADGYCDGNKRVFCDTFDQKLYTQDCTLANQTCVMSEVTVGIMAPVCGKGTCLDANASECQGNLLLTCSQGATLIRDCSAFGLMCGDAVVGGGKACTGDGDPCDGQTFEPVCVGTVVTRCIENRLSTFDCADQAGNKTCENGNDLCVPAGTQCEPGQESCQSSTIRVCVDGFFQQVDCADLGFSSCEIVAGGAHCRE